MLFNERFCIKVLCNELCSKRRVPSTSELMRQYVCNEHFCIRLLCNERPFGKMLSNERFCIKILCIWLLCNERPFDKMLFNERFCIKILGRPMYKGLRPSAPRGRTQLAAASHRSVELSAIIHQVVYGESL